MVTSVEITPWFEALMLLYRQVYKNQTWHDHFAPITVQRWRHKSLSEAERVNHSILGDRYSVLPLPCPFLQLLSMWQAPWHILGSQKSLWGFCWLLRHRWIHKMLLQIDKTWNCPDIPLTVRWLHANYLTFLKFYSHFLHSFNTLTRNYDIQKHYGNSSGQIADI